jgi:protein-ribulosamine 3-kinase
MCIGEFESLKAIYMVSPEFVPKPYAWGMFEWEGPDTYFLLTEFRDVGEQVC